MKKFAILLLLLSLYFPLFSQLSETKKYVGAQAFYYQNSEDWLDKDFKYNFSLKHFSISPELGFFLKKNISLGFVFRFENVQKDYLRDNLLYNSSDEDEIYRTTKIGFGITSAYYFPIYNRYYISIKSSLNYFYTVDYDCIFHYHPKWEEVWLAGGKMSNIQSAALFLYPEIGFYLFKNIRISALLGYAYFSYSKIESVLFDGTSIPTALPGRYFTEKNELKFGYNHLTSDFTFGIFYGF